MRLIKLSDLIFKKGTKKVLNIENFLDLFSLNSPYFLPLFSNLKLLILVSIS